MGRASPSAAARLVQCRSDMNISLNGQTEAVAEGITVAELIRQKLPQVQRLAVEVNLEIVPRSQHERCVLSAGDRVEIVRAIGGG